jgi:hypothetical protein
VRNTETEKNRIRKRAREVDTCRRERLGETRREKEKDGQREGERRREKEIDTQRERERDRD